MLSSELEIKQMSGRLSRLHKLYGMNVRFDGNANEDPANPGTNLDKAIDSTEEVDIKKSEEYTKQQQALDQETANAKKARDRAATSEAALDVSTQETEELKGQIATLKAKIGANDTEELAEINVEDMETDQERALAEHINQMIKVFKAKDDRITSLEGDAAKFKANAATQKTVSSRKAQYNSLLNDLDTDYGPQYRNAAVQAFQAKVKADEVPKNNVATATRILENCYKVAKEVAVKKAKDNPVDLDPGVGGGNADLGKRTTLTKGSLAQVAAQAAKMSTET